MLERDWLVATDQISDESAALSELFSANRSRGDARVWDLF